MWTEREDMFDDPFAYAMVPIRNRNTNISTDRFINNLIESDDDVG